MSDSFLRYPMAPCEIMSFLQRLVADSVRRQAMAYFLAVLAGLGSSSCTRHGTPLSSFFISRALAGQPSRVASACAATSRAPFDLDSSSRTSSGMHPCSPTPRFISFPSELAIRQMAAAAACCAPVDPTLSTWTSRGSTPSDTRLSADTQPTRFRSAATADSGGDGPSRQAIRPRSPPSDTTARRRPSVLDVRFCRHSAACSLDPPTPTAPPQQSSRPTMTRTIPTSANACHTSGTAERFLSAPAAADRETESPVRQISMSAPAPPWPTTARATSGDAPDRRCSVSAAFSRATRLPDSASLTSGGRTPSDTSSASQAPDSATRHTAAAAFSRTAGAGAVSSCTRAATLARPSTASTPFSSLRSASSSPSTARLLASVCPICSLASSSRTSASGGADGPTEASDSTPVLTSSAQSRRLRSSFPASASTALCVRSFPAAGGSRHRAASSAASASVAATDCSSSRHSAFLAKQGWLDRSERRAGRASSLAAIAFHRPGNPPAAAAASSAAGTIPRTRSSSSSAVSSPAAAGSPLLALISLLGRRCSDLDSGVDDEWLVEAQ
ncbi:hypothetical protein U9M48_005887 [Paspalum notatum var. saurae]|uniref:Uncharacterized protein n=1 Tax=Paspalum notatum var. saurae TaxID=547442 RepID=A0AAQ3PR22_PASNO